MDKKIVEKIKNRDQQGLDLLINTYIKNVYYIVNTIIGAYGTKEDIEECVSDIFLTIWRDIEKFDDKKGSLKTFILIKAKYNALDYKRKVTRNEDKINKIPIEEIEISRKYCVDKSTSTNEKLEEIIHIIKSFKEPDKTYFYLRYFMDYDIKSIANKFNDTRNAVENRLYRCRLKIRNIMGKE